MKKIPLSQGKFALVDDCDYKQLSKYKWCCAKLSGIDYVVRKKGNQMVSMHREILGVGSDQLVDHSNNNALDNRRSNIRLCTVSQNMMNRRKQKRKTTSKYKGVSWDSVNKKWRVWVTKDNHDYHVGRFDSEEDAAIMYNVAAQLFHGEFSSLNPI